MELDGIIYDRWVCAQKAKEIAFPLAVCTSSSHIGGIRINAINREYPDWFVGLILSVDRDLSIDKKNHSRLVYTRGTAIDIGEIRNKFTELRGYLKAPYQELDLIWEKKIAAYW